MIDWMKRKLGVTKVTVVVPALAKDRTGEVWRLDFRNGSPMVLVVGPPNCDEIKRNGLTGSALHPIVDLTTGRRDLLGEFHDGWDRGAWAMCRVA
jgi:hypothetical protein